MKKNKPIGIFDSGIGGLTVANAVTGLMPDENIVFFGDTAHLPYGDKSSKSIRYYADRIIRLLIDKECKIIVIACNSASASAFNSVNKKYGSKIEIINVIDPVVEYINENCSNKKIGVIGTKRTINSRVYPRKIKKLNPKIEITTLATPLLAPMIEEGFFNNQISKTIINAYLSKNNIQNIDTLILGCTHYPLIKNQIDQFYKGKVKVLDSAKIVAKKLKNILNKKNILNSKNQRADYNFFVSDYTKSFQETTKIFFNRSIPLKELNIWEK